MFSQPVLRLTWALVLLMESFVNAADSTNPSDAQTLFVEKSTAIHENEADVVFRYRLLRPREVKPGESYPLVLFFHGAGERGTNNVGQLKYFPSWMTEQRLREKYSCFILAPQCREAHSWSSFDITVDMQAAIKALDAVIESERVDINRIYVTGLSMGGAATWEAAMRMPERIAAAVPVCGRSETQYAYLAKDVPLWVFHGDADSVIPVECSRAMVAAVKEAGGNPRYTELPGVGHDAWTSAYHNQDMLAWLFQQKRSTAKTSHPTADRNIRSTRSD